MKTVITTLKAAIIIFLLLALNSCQDEPSFIESGTDPLYSSPFTETTNATEEDQDELIFNLDFENGLTARDSETPFLAGTLNFTAGINGQGLCFGRQDTLQYPVDGNIEHTNGSLSVWIKPNWRPNPELYKILEGVL